MDNQNNLEEAISIYEVFDRNYNSFVLATINSDQLPHSSYAPFVKYDDEYYFIISESAEHYRNLKNLPKCSLMFLQDELATSNVFFRKRLTYQAVVEEVDVDEVKDKMIEVHGALVDMLIDKLDFHIFKATPISGVMFLGPGRAYRIVDGELTHDVGDGNGHLRRDK